jgi:hypothetical protein
VGTGSGFFTDSEAFTTILATDADYITAEDCPGVEANGTVCGKVRLRLQLGSRLTYGI